MRILLLTTFFSGFITFAGAQDATIFAPPTEKRQVQATQIKDVLRIDGRLDEADWQRARPTRNFTQIEPKQGERTHHDTEVRVLYNQRFLYVAAFCRDSLGKKASRVPDFRRDFSFRAHEHFGLAIDGFNDRRNAMVFMTNSYSAQRDLLSFDDLLYDTDWDGFWKVRTTRTDSGWVAEMQIPWQTLRYNKPKPGGEADTTSWGINFIRSRRFSNESTAWAPYPRSFSALRMEYAGRITGLRPPPPSPNIRLQPYVLTSFDRYRDADGAYRRDASFKVGGELKWAINPNTVLDVTANTDFAQVDADRQVNNVTRFSVFFPERRQFFLENASLFGAGVSPSFDFSGGSMIIQPFFSRRIGLNDAGQPLPIDAGARLVYRSVDRNAGGMVIRQRGTADSPATTFAVGRYSQNFGRNVRLGGLFTLRTEADLTDTTGARLPGKSNWVGAADGFFRFGAAHSLSTMVMHSVSTNGQDRGVAGFAQYYYTSNQWKLWWTQSVVTKNFTPGVGFVSRSDVVATTPGIFWYNRGRWIPFKRWIRAFEPGIMTEFYHQASTGRLVERSFSINPLWFNFQRGGFFGFFFTPTYQFLTERFRPLGVSIAPGAYQYTRWAVWASSDPSKQVSYTVNYESGGYYGGRLSTTDATVRVAPIPHIALAGRYVGNRFRGVGEAQTDATVNLFSLEGRLGLNPRLQLIGIYQRNTTLQRDAWNVRLAWEYQPLSFLYVVFNRQAFTTTARQDEQHVIAKLSYLKQF